MFIVAAAMSTLITRVRSGKKLPQGSGDFQGFEGIEQIDPAAEETHEVRLLNRKTLTALDLPKVCIKFFGLWS
ncbi:hypothetical protein Bca4012_057566 [Brassica carinata]